MSECSAVDARPIYSRRLTVPVSNSDLGAAAFEKDVNPSNLFRQFFILGSFRKNARDEIRVIQRAANLERIAREQMDWRETDIARDQPQNRCGARVLQKRIWNAKAPFRKRRRRLGGRAQIRWVYRPRGPARW